MGQKIPVQQLKEKMMRIAVVSRTVSRSGRCSGVGRAPNSLLQVMSRERSAGGGTYEMTWCTR